MFACLKGKKTLIVGKEENADYQHFLFFLTMFSKVLSSPHSSVSSVEEFRTEACWFEPQAWPTLFPRIDYCRCDRIHFSLTVVHCYADGYVGKQPVVWKEHCVEY